MGMKSFCRSFNSRSSIPIQRSGTCYWIYNGIRYRLEARSSYVNIAKQLHGVWCTIRSTPYPSNPVEQTAQIRKLLSEFQGIVP